MLPVIADVIIPTGNWTLAHLLVGVVVLAALAALVAIALRELKITLPLWAVQVFWVVVVAFVIILAMRLVLSF